MIKDIKGDNFLQCNRNTLVNKNYIVSVDPVEKKINLKDNKGKKTLTIGRKYLEKVLKGIRNVD
ncbi:MAG: LytTR family transcriptional regulator [Lachnospiraceae bacterium]|nr:LytTR family transcriptional regulator [Lachnospiraceae bacterium]